MNYRKLNLVLIAVMFVVYLFSAKGYLEIVDTGYSVNTAISLLDHGSLAIQEGGMGAVAGMNGKLYSKYGLGLPLLFLPYVAIGTVLSDVTKLPRMELIGFIISFSNVLFGVATLFLFSRLLRKFAISEKTICFLTVALGLGTLCWRYAAYDYSEEIQMVLLVLAVLKLIRPTGRDLTWAGAAVAGLVLFKLIYVLVLPIFILRLLLPIPASSWKKALIQFSLPIVFAVVFIAGANAIRFGNPLASGYGSEADSFSPRQLGWTVPYLIASPQNGLLIFCPILILGLIGWPAFFRKHRTEALFYVGLIVMNLLWSGAWWAWYGGWSWGPRLLVPLLPLWLLPAAFFIDAPSRLRWFPAFLVLLGFSVSWQIPGVLVKDQEIHSLKEQKNGQSTAEEVAGMPSDITMSLILFAHKLAHSGEVYRMGDLTRQAGDPEKTIDLSSFHTFQGFNVWTEQMSRQFQKPIIRWLPLAGLLAILGLLATGLRASWNREKTKE